MAEQSHRPQARRAAPRLAAAAFLLLTLAGCELVPSAGPALPPPPPPPPPRENVSAPAPPVRQAPRQPVAPLPAEGTHHRIAVLVPITGANAGVGQSIANAANLALLDTGGERIRITVYDTARGAAGAADRALADGNRLFLGPLLAEDVRAVTPAAQRAGVPVVAFSNDVSAASRGVYLMGFTPGQSIDRVVAHARSEGLQRFASLVPEGLYGLRASQALITAVQRNRSTLIGNVPIPRGATGLRGAVGRLAELGRYDAVLVADSGRVGAAAAPLLRALPTDARILGTELWAAENGLGATVALRGAWYAAPSDAMFNQLRPRYRARYGAEPYRLASLGYDGVLLALRVAADWRIGRPFPEGELRGSRGFAGLDGAFRFGSDGIAERALEVREVTAGGTIVVSPAPRDFD